MNHILTAKKQCDGKIVLEITDQDMELNEGDRFKFFFTQDEVILRKVGGNWDILDRFFLDKEANTIFQYLIEKEPDRCSSNERFKYTMESSLRYAWVKRLTKHLQVDAEDVCAMMAMYDKELEEYKMVMKELHAFQNKLGSQTDKKE